MSILTDYLLDPIARAFLEVGVLVGPLLLLFGWLQWRTRGRLLERLTANRRAGPLLGALLGVIPGCGGAIVVMPLWMRGEVSFGTLVAALVATMGDSSFVLIAAAPDLALRVHLLLLLVGMLVGVLVDALRISPRPASRPATEPTVRLSAIPRLSTVGAMAARPDLPGPGVLLAHPGLLLGVFWALVAIGLVIGLPVLAGATDGPRLARHLGGVDPVLVVGGLGTLLSAVVFAGTRDKLRDDTMSSVAAKLSSMRAVLVESARETTFVTVWVAIAFIVTALVVGLGDIPLLAGEGSGAVFVGRAGLAAVFVAALIGLLPGCGPQIVLTGLYVSGVLPFSVLIANALSQDGDALFPLLAGHRRAAGLATVITTVPGVVAGILFWSLGY
jgi:hypothetical protein